MKIFAKSRDDEYNKLIQERNAYKADYDKRTSNYNSQYADFDMLATSFSYEVEDKLKEELSDTLEKIKGVEIEVYFDDFYEVRKDKIRYSVDFNYHGIGKNALNKHSGFDWSIKFAIYVNISNHEISVLKTDTLKIQTVGTLDNYEQLKDTYDIVTEISQIDWDTLFKDIFKDSPVFKEIVTEPEPESEKTYQYDNKIQAEIMKKYVGTDNWILCRVDYLNLRTWINILKIANNYVTFRCIEGGRVDQYELVMGNFTVTLPVEVMTTSEIAEQFPEANV